MDQARRIALTIVLIVGVVMIAAALSGCTPFWVKPDTSSNLCSAGPIILSPAAADRLTRAEKEQITAMNNSGADICGWTTE